MIIVMIMIIMIITAPEARRATARGAREARRLGGWKKYCYYSLNIICIIILHTCNNYTYVH